MKRKRTYPLAFASVLLLLALSACGTAAPAPTATAAIPPTVPPPTAILPPTDIPTPAPTPTPAPVTYPPQRGFPIMVYNSKADTVLMFAGEDRDYEGRDDAWSYKTSTNTWTPLTSLNPVFQTAFTIGFAADYDSKADKLVFHLNSRASRGPVYRALGETYVYDPNTDKMDKVTPKDTPYDFGGSRMVYDSESDRFILFGGFSGKKGVAIDETWAYDLNTNTWTAMNPAKHPSGRNQHQMAYIPTIDRVLLCGGWTDGFGQSADTWLYDYNHDTWKELNPPLKPAYRFWSSMVYVSSIDRVLMYGGQAPATGVMGDLWSFDPKTLIWEELHPATDPGTRVGYGMAYDSKADKVVLFGGSSEDGFGPYIDETWLYDPQANTWTNVTPET